MGNIITRFVDRVRGRKSKKNKKLSAKEHQKKQRESEIKSLIWEVFFYIVFLILLAITAFNNRDERAFRFRVGILNFMDNNNAVNKIRTPADLWNWTQKIFTPFLYQTVDWRGEPVTSKDSRMVANLASYRLGPIRLRQHRMKNQSCSVPGEFHLKNIRCTPDWSSSDRVWEDYGPSWTDLKTTSNRSLAVQDSFGLMTSFRSAWIYRNWSSIGGLPITANLGVYPPGGYVIDITGSMEDALQAVSYLQKNSWVDNETKVVLMEVTLYCSNVNLFAMITAIFEFPQAEVIMGQIHIHPFRLFSYLGGYPIARMVCDYLVYVAILWFALRECHEIKEMKLKYFKEFWNVLKLANLLTSITAIVLYIGRHIVTDHVSREAAKSTGQFFNFQTLAMWDELFGFLVAFVCFLSTLQVLHLVRFNKRMSVLGSTMMKSAKDLTSFAFVFLLVLLAFLSFSFIAFGPFLKSYKSVIDSCEALLLVALGHLDYNNLTAANRVFTPLFIFLYMMFIVFILMNVLISILMESFAEVRDDVSKQSNDYELIEYMVSTATRFLWKYNPFRQLWAVACKTGLVADTQPDSIRTAPKKVVKAAAKPNSTNKTNQDLKGPEFHTGPKNRHHAKCMKNLLNLHVKLDIIQDRFNRIFPELNNIDVHVENVVSKHARTGSGKKVTFSEDKCVEFANDEGAVSKSNTQQLVIDHELNEKNKASFLDSALSDHRKPSSDKRDSLLSLNLDTIDSLMDSRMSLSPCLSPLYHMVPDQRVPLDPRCLSNSNSPVSVVPEAGSKNQTISDPEVSLKAQLHYITDIWMGSDRNPDDDTESRTFSKDIGQDLRKAHRMGDVGLSIIDESYNRGLSVADDRRYMTLTYL